MATMLIVKLSGPNYLLIGSATYFFWPGSAMKKLLSHYGWREPRKFGNCWVSDCYHTFMPRLH